MTINKVNQYHKDTSAEVINILEQLYKSKERCRLYYGDTSTGLSWLDEYDIYGTIARSTGQKPIPLLINNTRSYGGSHILDHCIIRIDVKDRTLYKHPSFHLPVLTLRDTTVLANGIDHATFKTIAKAERWIKFISGEQFGK